jgi:NAD(P) transhydrogenase subunit beta
VKIMADNLVTLAYLVAGVLFILSLRGLGTQETARRGNVLGILGMSLALVATAVGHVTEFPLLVGVIVVGFAVGAALAARVQMTAMPELVAVLHSFVGAAAVLVGIASYLGRHDLPPLEARLHDGEVFAGVFVGAITFSGSVVAFGKLRGLIGSKPLLLPGRHLVNLAAVLASLALAPWIIGAPTAEGLPPLLGVTALALALGVHLVMAIGGADMPVVVSMLNSYSGWAAAAAGFMLGNDLLIITGALVGSSGAILSYIMCKAMNRSIVSVLFGGFGADEGARPKRGANAAPSGEAKPITLPETAELLRAARRVVIVPGYGMAVAHAQYPVYEVAEWLRKRGASVRFAIHPVAGRLPGHMNVLLAEAKVPYDIVLEMEEINPELPEADIVLVIGANDIVNPAALDDPSSPIYGMPVLEVWRAKATIVFKRSLAAGYAGIENPLFVHENTRMLFGDAKANVTALLTALNAGRADAA